MDTEKTPGPDLNPDEAKKQRIQSEDELLARNFSDMSYNDLILVKEILMKRMEPLARFRKEFNDLKDLYTVVGLKEQHRITWNHFERTAEEVMADMEDSIKKKNYPMDLQIVEGLLSKKVQE